MWENPQKLPSNLTENTLVLYSYLGKSEEEELILGIVDETGQC